MHERVPHQVVTDEQWYILRTIPRGDWRYLMPSEEVVAEQLRRMGLLWTARTTEPSCRGWTTLEMARLTYEGLRELSRDNP